MDASAPGIDQGRTVSRTRLPIAVALGVLLHIGIPFKGVSQDDSPGSTKRSSPDSVAQESWLARYDLGMKDPRTIRLSSKLREVSGLVMTVDGRLLCHDDESAIVNEVDYHTGDIVKRFTVGSGFMEEDFEGIAVKADTLFLVDSSGELFEFHEKEDRKHAEFRLYKTFLSEKYDVEGLEYDPVTDCLLLACKGYAGRGKKGFKAIYAFDLKKRLLEPTPRFLIPLREVEKKARKGEFNPSGIAFHPAAGTLFIISADGELVIETDRTGRILDQQKIPRKTNRQPEGITFTADNMMIIANDGQGEQGTLTLYPAGGE